MNKAVLLFLTAIIFWGCENDNDPQIQFDPSYFPLQVGNYWEYDPVSKYIPVSQSEHLLSVSVQIPSTATIGDYEYYLMVTKYVYTGFTYVTDSSYYRVNSRGYVFQRTSQGLEDANPFRLAVAEGETWTIKAPPLKDFVVTTGEIGSCSLNVITIENCKSYSFDLPPAIDDEHIVILAPGLGIVKRIFGEGFDSILKKATISGIEYNF